MKHQHSAQFLTLVLLTALLASCGDCTPTSDTTAADTTAAADTSTVSVETGVPDDLGTYDFEGRIFNIAYSSEQLGSTWPYTVEEENGDILSDAVYRRDMNVEERFNCQITWYDAGGNTTNQIDAFRNSILAGDEAYMCWIRTAIYLKTFTFAGIPTEASWCLIFLTVKNPAISSFAAVIPKHRSVWQDAVTWYWVRNFQRNTRQYMSGRPNSALCRIARIRSVPISARTAQSSDSGLQTVWRTFVFFAAAICPEVSFRWTVSH